MWKYRMPQLHCYVKEELADKLQIKAQQAHLSVSKYLALLVEKEVGAQWPEGYFELFGSWSGDPLERPSQGEYEQRVSFD
jgi:hypothetical protein